MLKHIYVTTEIIENNSEIEQNYDKFVHMMQDSNIDTQKLDIRAVVLKKCTFGDILRRLLPESLVVTTCASTCNLLDKNIFCVGFGEDYGGKLPYVVTDFDISPQYIRLIYARYTHTPLVIAVTKRLLIREIQLSDVKDLFQMYATLSDCVYLEPLYPYEKELEFTRNYIENMYGFFQYGLWLVFEKSTGMLVGRVGIENRVIDGIMRQELGYVIGSKWQQKGFAFEAATAVLQYAKDELFLKELFICVQKSNIPSIALAKKLGFSQYGETEEYFIWHRML